MKRKEDQCMTSALLALLLLVSFVSSCQASFMNFLETVVSKTTWFVMCVPMTGVTTMACILSAARPGGHKNCCIAIQKILIRHCELDVPSWKILEMNQRCAELNVPLQ